MRQGIGAVFVDLGVLGAAACDGSSGHEATATRTAERPSLWFVGRRPSPGEGIDQRRSYIAGRPSLRWSQVTVFSTCIFTTTRLLTIASTNGFMSSVYGAL